MAFLPALESNKKRRKRSQGGLPLKDYAGVHDFSLRMDGPLREQRKSYRRSGDRRRRSDRRGMSDRRCRSCVRSAPASRITLYSITLRSLAKALPSSPMSW